MAVRTNEPEGPAGSHGRRLPDSLSRYDLVLAAIPILFALAALSAALLTVPIQVGIAAGAAGSVVLVADVLYVNPPSDVSADG